jgi:digeranylgeranylglycerophospholipid reductase
LKFDLIVVGAGPAGSMAAKTAASAGLKVALLEKRQEIGSPVRCAGGVSRSCLCELLKPDPSWIAAEVKGTRVYAPDGCSIVLSEGLAIDEVGYILERNIFDRSLAIDAAQAGADVFIKTRAVGLLKSDGVLNGVSARRAGESLRMEAPLVVGADGIESKIGRYAGIDTTLKPENIEVCTQFIVQDPGIDEDYCEFYLGNNVAPGGYVWSLPRGGGKANVGVCIQGSRSSPGMTMRLLSEFLKGRMPEAKILDVVAGGVPSSGPIKRAISDGIMLAGDCAAQSDPFTYAGILNGMRAGIMAGEVAADAAAKGDTGIGQLKVYEDRWRRTIGKEISRNYRLKSLFTRLNDNDLNGVVHSLEQCDTANCDLNGLVRRLFRLNPRMFWKAGYLFI